jgi:hypothetical protein
VASWHAQLPLPGHLCCVAGSPCLATGRSVSISLLQMIAGAEETCQQLKDAYTQDCYVLSRESNISNTQSKALPREFVQYCVLRVRVHPSWMSFFRNIV